MLKKHAALIRKLPLWHNPVTEPLGGGMTNFNYLVTGGKKKYVARFALKSNVLLGLDRKREVANTRIAFALGIGPKIVKFFPKQNCLVVEYIEGSIFNSDQGRKPENIRKMARLFKKLHTGPKFRGKFDPFAVIEDYVAVAKSRKSWMPSDIDRSLTKLHALKKIIGPFQLQYPCHLDLVLENIVSTKKNLKLIDWEYSANSDPRFDLAMFSVKGKFDARHDKALLGAYGIKISPAQFAAMKAIVHFREGSWGLVQLAVSKIPYNYKKYAKDNIRSFNAIARRLA